jgi:hypothetical protein
MEPEKKPGKWRRRLKRALKVFLVVVVVLVLLLVLLHALWNFVAGRKLEEQLQAMRQAGEPVTLADLYPELSYPEAENAAHVYRAAFELMTGLSLDSKDHPFLKRTWTDTDPTQWSEEDVAELRKLLNEYRLSIDLGRRAAHMPHCRFLPQFDAATGFPMLEELTGMRHLGWVTLLDSLLRLHDGDADGALRGCTTAFPMARSLEGNPVIITFLVQVAIQHVSLRTAEVVLDQGNPSPEACRELLAAVREADANLRSSLRRAYEAERVVAICSMEAIFGGEPVLPKRPSPVALHLPRKRVSYWKRPLQRSWLAGVLEATAPIPALATEPYPQARLEMERLNAAGYEPTSPTLRLWKKLRNPGRTMGLMVVPVYIKAKGEETNAEARLAVAQTALALRLYKAERGQYPDSLDALSPAFLDEVPADPCTGSNLNFRREADGFLLYSIGLNGKDDGGITMTWEDSKMVNPDTDDIAWRASR